MATRGGAPGTTDPLDGLQTLEPLAEEEKRGDEEAQGAADDGDDDESVQLEDDSKIIARDLGIDPEIAGALKKDDMIDSEDLDDRTKNRRMAIKAQNERMKRERTQPTPTPKKPRFRAPGIYQESGEDTDDVVRKMMVPEKSKTEREQSRGEGWYTEEDRAFVYQPRIGWEKHRQTGNAHDDLFG
mmetsp:Transcript_9102/g.17745  ORF Transcript_9102/g.17745 Transcript_9102/m.17745 type:complete len:185 (+) Transcript_9102:1-555(+)